ncbi:cell division control protein Cdc6 [Candidatus Micrarchaeota archaeon CG08_land_8_20_14_0_20_59_11]|nr:MAG: cell division control protein Cdc6 [Candidatus Micrarchaeota archaeon CG08_land_8_20_14_0_20_59_11]
MGLVASPSFDEFAGAGAIFRNKDMLSPAFVPETLLFREEETRALMSALAPVLRSQKAKNVFIYGKTGTGKTATTRSVLKKLDSQRNEHVKTVYLNCRIYDTRYKVLQKCISDFQSDFAKTGHSFVVLYDKFLDWVQDGVGDGVKGKRVVFVLDEVDVVDDLDSLIYTLSRANDDLKDGSVSIIGISNKVDLKQRLEARSRSSLCEDEMVFKPYDAMQLQGILKQRAKQAFNDGAVVESAINLSAAIAAGENGDARYALALLLRAGELAEKRGAKKVSDKEVEDSRRAVDEDKAFDIISTLPEHQQLLLYTLATMGGVSYKKLVEENGEQLYFSGEVYERYAQLCRKLSKEPRTSRWFREYLSELENLGLVLGVDSGKGVRGHTTLLKLAYDPVKVKKAVDRALFAE